MVEALLMVRTTSEPVAPVEFPSISKSESGAELPMPILPPEITAKRLSVAPPAKS